MEKEERLQETGHGRSDRSGHRCPLDQIDERLKDLIKEAIVSNTDVRIEANDEEIKYEPKGEAIEVGMIEFLMDNDEDV